MIKTLFTLLTFLAASSAHSEVGFSNGNDLDITYYSGRVIIFNCPDTIGATSYFCDGADYNPGAFDRFTLDQRVNADRVELTAFHEDGSDRTKKKKYDANKSLSKKFNLLIGTLFQRPLLEPGKNLVSYKLTKKRREVASGEFEANVEIAGDLRCPDLTISGWGGACDNVSTACQEYFRRVTNCQ